MIRRRKPIARTRKPIRRSTAPAWDRAFKWLERKRKRARRSRLGRGLAYAKTGKLTKDRRAERRETTMADAARDREQVRERQHGLCIAFGVSPLCTKFMDDPHELIGVGAGGKRISSNRVGICRTDHREAQGRVGGNRLIFDWPGKAEGRPPNADEPGNVTARWRPVQKRTA